jgi:hypothetical protein
LADLSKGSPFLKFTIMEGIVDTNIKFFKKDRHKKFNTVLNFTMIKKFPKNCKKSRYKVGTISGQTQKP